jgi:NAD(P)-dependent dehydrogenase (short-subunit alcohol dehydrogenase family)
MKWIMISGCDSGFGAIMVEKIKAMKDVGVFAGCFLQGTVDRLDAEQRDDVKPVRLDVTCEDSVKSCAEYIASELGSNQGLYGLVNNAGILINPGPTEWTPLRAYRQMFDVNVIGTVALTKYCLPLIRKSQGRIVNVASIAGRSGLPSEPAYCASKYAVEGYSDVLRRDMAPWGVTVHIIEPGVFPNTGLYDKFQSGLDTLWNDLAPELKEEYGEEYYQHFREKIGKSLTVMPNTDSSMVPEAMLDALFSPAPKYRYRVGNDSKYLITLLNMCHESTQDWLYGRGHNKTGGSPVTAPKDGYNSATSRYGTDWSRPILMLLLSFVGYKAIRPWL